MCSSSAHTDLPFLSSSNAVTSLSAGDDGADVPSAASVASAVTSAMRVSCLAAATGKCKLHFIFIQCGPFTDLVHWKLVGEGDVASL
jgi:hypothetical protein